MQKLLFLFLHFCSYLGSISLCVNAVTVTTFGRKYIKLSYSTLNFSSFTVDLFQFFRVDKIAADIKVFFPFLPTKNKCTFFFSKFQFDFRTNFFRVFFSPNKFTLKFWTFSFRVVLSSLPKPECKLYVVFPILSCTLCGAHLFP